jgi:hypothetical protein
MLSGFVALRTAAAMAAAMRRTVSAPASPAGTPSEEPCKERVELCDSIRGHGNGDLLVIGHGWA